MHTYSAMDANNDFVLWLHQRRVDAIMLRAELVAAQMVSVDLNTRLSHHTTLMTGIDEYREPTHRFADAVVLTNRLLQKWEFHDALVLPKGRLWRASVRLKKIPEVIRWGRKVSKFAGIALMAIAFQIHIDELDQQIEDAKKS